MELTELKAQIKANKFKNFLIFTGPELAVQDIYVKQIAKVRNLDIIHPDTVKDFLFTNKTQTLLGKPKLGGILYDEDFLALSADKQAEIVERINSGKNVCILRYESLDKRTSFYKTYKDNIVDFQPLTEAILIHYIQKKMPLSETNCKRLISICGGNYGRILYECDKIANKVDAYYGQTHEEVKDSEKVNKMFDLLIADGTINIPPKDVIFDFVNAVLERRTKDALKLMKECIDGGEPALVMLSVLYSNFRNLLQVQSYRSNGTRSKSITEVTGLSGWNVKCVESGVNKYGLMELTRALGTIQSAESGIKTGRMDESIAVPYTVVNILGGTA